MQRVTVQIEEAPAMGTQASGAAQRLRLACTDGRFNLPLAPGQHALRVWSEGHLPSDWQRVDIGPRGAVTCEFRLEPEALLQGRIVHPDGSPAMHVALELTPDSSSDGSTASSKSARTGADGQFSFRQLQSGEYDLRIAGAEVTERFILAAGEEPVSYTHLTLPTIYPV